MLGDGYEQSLPASEPRGFSQEEEGHKFGMAGFPGKHG